MSGRPRNQVIREGEVGVYHVWMRCVRRSYLCGRDRLTGRDFSHRKAWFHDRLKELAHIFAVDACVWAIMSNHYHLIVRNRPDLVKGWSDEEVARRWWQLYPERKDEQGRPAEPKDIEIRSMVSDPKRIAELRKRLSSISWFMKSLNEWFAKAANAEENQHGHFWEERFGCRNLLDEGAILACSIYIDLNEIRALLAESPETSINTSAYRRILARLLRRQRAAASGDALLGMDYRAEDPDYWMCPLNETDRAPLLRPGNSEAPAGEMNSANWAALDAAKAEKTWRHGFLPMTVDQYLELLDLTGRRLVEGKSGAIDDKLAPILERLGLRPVTWMAMVTEFEKWFHGAVGNVDQIREHAASTDRCWIQGMRHCRDAFCSQES